VQQQTTYLPEEAALTGEAVVGEFEVVSIRDELYPYGFRKIAALLLVTTVTVLPRLISWQNEPAERPRASEMPTGRFGPRGGFLSEREELSWSTDS
jgi:hypothetical protein